MLRHSPRNGVTTARAESIAHTYAKALSAILASPEHAVHGIDLFSAHDRSIVDQWNKHTPALIHERVHETIQARATSDPEAPAVDAWDEQFSYAQLDKFANRLAHELVRRGAGPEVKIPFCFSKSAWSIVAILAIMKSGAAFLPLNRSDPEERVRSLIEEAGASFVLASSDQVEKLQGFVETVIVVSKACIYELPDIQEPLSIGSNEDAAYVLFTSGSTGKPKGVVIEHRNLSSNIAEHAPGLGFNTQSRVLQFASYTFDASITEILATLWSGGCVCVPSEEERTTDVEGAMRRMSTTFAMLTPSVVQILSPDNLPSLQTLALVGEAVPKSLINKWSERLSLFVGYGPTETAVFASIGHLTPREDNGFIGTAAGTVTWIVNPDNHNLLTPIGSVGELVLSGPTLAREYLNNPAKTAEVFVPTPRWASSDSIDRVYKTGDLVYYRDDGGIMYIGRKDSQVKIHGQRVELGEIEQQVLACLPAQSEAVVGVLRGIEALSALRLVAFVCIPGFDQVVDATALAIPMSPELSATLSKLQTDLSRKISAYMVPSLYVPLAVLPKSAAGKADRNAMLKIAQGLTQDQLDAYSLKSAAKRPVTTSTEQIIQSVWASVLAIPSDSIGADDHFFRLGGDSLTAMKIASHLRSQNVTVSVPDIFKHPQLSELATLIGTDGEPSSALQVTDLAPFELLQEKHAVVARAHALADNQAMSVEDAYPATPLQQALFALTQNDPKAYVNRMVFKISKSIDLASFKLAWSSVYTANPILRTAIINTETDGTCQVIYGTEINWQEATGSLNEYLSTDSSVAIREGNLLTRYGLVTDGSDRYFVWTAHHAVYDGWSTDLIFDMVHRAYQGKTSEPLAPYTRFIQYLSDLDKIQADQYWHGQLATYSGSDFPSTPAAHKVVSDGTIEQILQLPSDSRKSEITTATLLRAAWALLISKQTTSNDVVFGMTQSGRNAPVAGIERIQGPTIATVAVRVQIDSSKSTTQYLQDINLQAAEMIPHEQTGLRQIKSLGAGAKSACDFRNLLVIQSHRHLESDDSSWITPIESDLSGFDTMPITVECSIGSAGTVELAAHFDTRLLSSLQVQRILSQFSHVAHQLSEANAEHKISDLNFFTPEDNDLVQQWNGSVPPTYRHCLQDRFEKFAQETPEKEAIHSWDGSFTYHEVDSLATRLAYQLVASGVKAGDYVPFCFEKSAWAIVSMLASLKAGAAFVPLDPGHPASRLNDIISQTAAKVMLASAAAPPLDVEKTITVSSSTVSSLPSDTSCSLPAKDPSAIAYIIFTSGSTGRPKGVMLTHQAICSSAPMLDLPDIGLHQDSRVYQFPSYVFDAAVFNIFGALSAGATLCVPSDTDRLGVNLAKSMRDMQVTWSAMTAGIIRLFQPEDVPTLKTMKLGGDAVYQEDVDRWASKVQMIQGYGPAEASVFVTWNIMGAEAAPNNVGPAARARLWIVDPENHDQLTPVGLVGEMLIEGPGLASGYLNDEVKTASAFIVDPAWCRGQQRRFYKTGDLVRYTDDGAFLFVGRKDGQVKLNGQRVELAEIENHIFSSLPSCQLAVVLPKSGPLKNLLTAIISDANSGSSSNELSFVSAGTFRDALIAKVTEVADDLPERMPRYMVPRTWLAVRKLPFNSSGKIDKKKIQEWLECLKDDEVHAQKLQAKHKSTDVMATNEMESILQQALSRVLNLSPDSIAFNRSFMALGGDSITAMQLASRLQASNVVLSTRHLLESKTIKDVAAMARFKAERLEIAEEAMDVPFQLSPIQKMFIGLVQPSPNSPRRFNQSFLLQITRSIRPEKLTAAIDFLVARHSMLRARYQQDADGCWTQRVLPRAGGSYRLTIHPSVDIEHVMAQSQSSLDIVNGPVFVADLLTQPDGSQVLFMAAHHMAVDLVSWRIILNELEDHLTTAGNVTLPRALPFQTWLSLQHEQAQKIQPDSALPFDLPNQDASYWNVASDTNTFANIDEHEFTIDAESTSRLLNDCSSALGTDTLDVLMGALVHAFSQTFQDRPLPSIFTEGHGRESWDDSIDVSSTVGWFTTMSPIHVAAEAGDDIVRFVRKVKDRRRQIPMNGWKYFVSRFLNTEGQQRFAQDGPVEVILNFAGQYQQLERQDALFQLMPRDELGTETCDVSPEMIRTSVIEISAGISDGSLKVTFMWPKSLERHEQVKQWSSNTQASIMSAIATLRGLTKQVTPSDFPLLSLTDEEFDSLVNESLPKQKIMDLNNVEDMYPATALQEALMMSRSIDSGLYAVRVVYKLSEANGQSIDIDRFQAAWSAVIDRHQTLRTVFVDTVSEKSALTQVVLKHLPANTIRIVSDTDEEAIKTLERPNAITPGIALDIASPCQLTLCHVASTGNTYCKIDVNHAVTDGGSSGIMLRDLGLAYDNLLSPGRGPLFGDYVSYLLKGDRNASLEYWGNYLRGLEPCMINNGFATNEKKVLRDLEFEIPNAARLRTFSASNSVTLANLFQAAWAMVLRNFANTDQVCFGYLNAGRDAPVEGIREAIGLFINMLVSRVDFTDNLDAQSLLQTVQSDYINALDHQNCSLADMQKLAGNTLFNTIMSYQTVSETSDDATGTLNFEQVTAHDPTEYALSVSVAVAERSVFVTVSYYTDSVSDFQATSVATSFEKAILGLVAAAPNTSAQDISTLGDQAIDKVKEWNGNYPKILERCVHHLIQDRVDEDPTAMAVCSTEVSWTYGELNELANRLAHRLAILGIRPGTKVPYCYDASPWTIVVMLAILKSGGACVALDPKHPTDRLHGILEDVDADIVISSPHHASKFLSVAAVMALGPDEIKRLNVTLRQKTKPLPETQATDLAFVNFTSGSTGKPKGILLQHQAIATSGTYYGAAMGYGPGSRVLQFSSYTFDVSLSDIFFSLMRGGAVCVPTEYEKLNDLPGFVNRLGANVADLTPSVLEAMLRPEEVPCLKTICLGGEAVKQENLSVWADKVALHNYYGPSEASVACVGRSNLSFTDQAANIGVGCGALTWIVEADNANKLAPLGTVGELLLEGPLLAMGYLKLPAKTTEAFLPDVTWPGFTEPKRLYKTGDLVRYTEDGSLEYLGRKDNQVKIRGQRVEIGEIEHHAILNSSPEYSQVAVEAVTIPGRVGMVLIAFIAVGSQIDACTDAALPIKILTAFRNLQASLTASLPSYMVPSLYIPLRELPLSTAGKRDRKALRQIPAGLSDAELRTFSLADDSISKREPSTATEQRLRPVWAKVLRVQEADVGVDESFFRLGGDSIAAMRLAAAATKSGVQISVLDILTHKTISKIAAVADGQVDEAYATQSLTSSSGVGSESVDKFSTHGGTPTRLDIDPTEVEIVYPITAAQKELIQASKNSPTSGYYHIPQIFEVLSRNDNGKVDAQRFHNAWQQVIDRHPILRTVFDDTLGQIVLKTYKADVTYLDLEDPEDLSKQNISMPLDKATPLHRLALAKTPTGQLFCRLDIHHSITDGYSLMTMFEELASAYENALPLGKGPSMRDYISQIESLDRNTALSHWKSVMNGLSQVPQFPRKANLLGSTTHTHLRELHTQVQNSTLPKFCLVNECTMPSLIYAAWGLVLATLCGNQTRDVVFAYLTSARTIIPSEALGFLVNTVLHRITTDRTLPLATLLQQSHESVLSALPHAYITPSELGVHVSSLVNVRKFDDEALAALDANEEASLTTNGITFKATPSPDPMAVSIFQLFSQDASLYRNMLLTFLLPV